MSFPHPDSGKIEAALAWADGGNETPEMRAALGIEPDDTWTTEDDAALAILAAAFRQSRTVCLRGTCGSFQGATVTTGGAIDLPFRIKGARK